MKYVLFLIMLTVGTPCLSMHDNGSEHWQQTSSGNIGQSCVDVTLTQDSTGMITCSLNHPVMMWATKDGSYLSDLPPLTELVSTVAISSHNEFIATGFINGCVRVWPRRGDSLFLTGYAGEVDVVTFSPDETMVAACARDQIVKIWATKTGAKLQEFTVPTIDNAYHEITSLIFSPDNTVLACGSSDGSISLWRLSDGQLCRQLRGHTEMLSALAFSPDGALLASGAYDGTARLWDVEGGEEITRFNVCGYSPIMVAFSPDGLHLATGADPRTGGPQTLGPLECPVKIWDIATGEQTRLHSSHCDGAAADCLVFSPDGTRVVTASRHGLVKTWARS